MAGSLPLSRDSSPFARVPHPTFVTIPRGVHSSTEVGRGEARVADALLEGQDAAFDRIDQGQPVGTRFSRCFASSSTASRLTTKRTVSPATHSGAWSS